METTRKDIEAETRRALDEIRKEVADLTVIATEKVTRKSLDSDDHQPPDRGGAVRGRLLGARRRRPGSGGTAARWRRSPRSTRARCSRSPPSTGDLDRVHEELGEFADALNESRDLRVFFFSPYFSSQEKKDGIARADRGRRRELRPLPRAAGRAPPHAGDLPHPARLRRACGARRTSCCRSPSRARSSWTRSSWSGIGKRIEEQTGQRVELSSKVDPDVLGRDRAPGREHGAGRQRAEPARETEKERGQGRVEKVEPNPMQIKPDEITSILKCRIEGLDCRRRRPLRGGHRALDRRRHLARARARQLHVARDARAAPRRDGPGAQPRVRQRRRRAVRRLGQDRGGRHGQAHRQPARDPRRRRAARPHRRPRSASRSTARAT